MSMGKRVTSFQIYPILRDRKPSAARSSNHPLLESRAALSLRPPPSLGQPSATRSHTMLYIQAHSFGREYDIVPDVSCLQSFNAVKPWTAEPLQGYLQNKRSQRSWSGSNLCMAHAINSRGWIDGAGFSAFMQVYCTLRKMSLFGQRPILVALQNVPKSTLSTSSEHALTTYHRLQGKNILGEMFLKEKVLPNHAQ